MTISGPEIYFIAAMLTFVACFGLLRVQVAIVEARTRSLWMVNAKLDLLLEHASVAFDPHKNMSRHVLDALQRGGKIDAIKEYRKVSGVGLKEAKDFVEEIQRQTTI
jgi:ribosomal protein L7/L12